MKEVWIWNHYATDMFFEKGGRHYNFAKYLLNMGYSPTVFCANTLHVKSTAIETGGAVYKKDFADKIPYLFIKTSPYKGNGFSRIKNMLFFSINLSRAAKEYSKENKPDVIIASSVHPFTCVMGILTARKFKIPCVVEIRDLWPEAIFAFGSVKEKSLIGKLLIAGEHWIYKKAGAIIFTKEGDIDYVKERGWLTKNDVNPEKCFYINNGVDLDGFERSAQENKLDDPDLTADKFNVIYCGAIRPVNNIENILDAAILLKDDDKIQFLIYGEGSQLAQLRRRIHEENITNVKLKGFVSKTQIPYILSKSSLNLLNYSGGLFNWSRGNSSNKLFEYMASGKPVLSTVKMGYCLLERYNCGISIPNDTPEELAAAILEIKNMPSEQYREMSDNAKTAACDFDYKALTGKLEIILLGVVKNA